MKSGRIAGSRLNMVTGRSYVMPPVNKVGTSDMSKFDLAKRLRQYGSWAFARFCAKRSVPFEVCYEVIFGRQPRFI